VRTNAYWALAVIFLANFLNYTDRQLVSALEKQLREEPTLRLDPDQFGLLWTLFTVGYMVCAVPIGLVADRNRRPTLFAACIVIWSLATVASGMAQDKLLLYAARVFTGVGEAGCLVIGPALLSDYFSLRARSRALSVFYLGMPLGGVMAYLLVALLHNDLTWREMFYAAGAPGFVLALLIFFLKDPPRGHAEMTAGRTKDRKQTVLGGYLQLLKTPTLVLIILAQACAVIILVPLLHFGKGFFLEVHKMTEEQTGVAMGILALVGGLGSVVSGIFGSWLGQRTKGGAALLAGVGYLAALPCLYVGFTADSRVVFQTALSLGSFFLFFCMPAVNTQIANVVRPRLRATAWALAVFVLHLLGDASSPPLFGRLMEAVGRETAFLRFSLALVPASLCCFIAVFTAARDTDRAQQG
jgi:predicted MFS family arabinose efflux permease